MAVSYVCKFVTFILLGYLILGVCMLYLCDELKYLFFCFEDSQSCPLGLFTWYVHTKKIRFRQPFSGA